MSNDPSTPAPKLQPRVSRRDFVKVAGAGAIATTAIGSTTVNAATPLTFEKEVDVLVVGSGGAAYVAAVTARAAGASVLILEKAPVPGGTTARSGGGAWLPNNFDVVKQGKADKKGPTMQYLVRAAYPHLFTPSDKYLGIPKSNYDVIEAFFDNAAPAIAALEKHGQLLLDGEKRDLPELYVEPEPVKDFVANPMRTMYPRKVPGASPAPGAEWIRQMKAWGDKNEVPLLVGHRVTRILQNAKNEVIGLEVTLKNGTVKNFRARKGVIFGSGGFTNNREMVLKFQPFGTYGGCAVPSNEGDLVTMGTRVGTQLGNMNSAFRVEVVVDQALEYSSLISDVWQPAGESMIYVNARGQRNVNEKRNYNDRTRAHFTYDPTTGTYPAQIQVMVWDQRTADLNAGNFPHPAPGATAPYVISGKTIDELSANITKHVDKLRSKVGPLANIGTWRTTPDFAKNLKASIERFNGFAKKGIDEDFARGAKRYETQWQTVQFAPQNPGTKWTNDEPNATMHSFTAEGPYYACLVGAGTLDTNGGPVINPKAQMLDADNKPIPGLYGAGNCIAAPSATTYWAGGGTLGAALTFGWIAGNAIVKEPVKDLT